jgi:hypothetical protein
VPGSERSITFLSHSIVAVVKVSGKIWRGGKSLVTKRKLVGLGRVELPTYGLGNRRSIHLSYSPASTEYHSAASCLSDPYHGWLASRRAVINPLGIQGVPAGS